ncbi:MAG TPA: DUF3426 domain-containing protein, partial [Bordetella sp.]
MALTTRCPHCRTAFKVVADQLRVRNGLVRCGACGTVFDGRACLEGEQAAPVPAYAASSQASSLVNNPPALRTPVPAEPARPAVEPPAVLRGRDRHAVEPDPAPADDGSGYEDDDNVDDREIGGHEAGDHGIGHPAAGHPPPIRAYDPEDYPPQQDEPEFTVGGAQAETSGDGIYGDVRTRFSSADAGRAPPAFLDQDRINTHRTRRRIWAWLCLLALLALAGQLAYVYRTPIALSAPALRPVLAGLCKPMGCTVGYARRIERIFIESSSLRPPQGAASQTDEDGRSRLILAAVLRNRYDKDQEWPAVTLSLTDMSDTVIARKIIRPEDYLPPGTAGPMAAGTEVTISV